MAQLGKFIGELWRAGGKKRIKRGGQKEGRKKGAAEFALRRASGQVV
jgi:hypothetical protein